MTADGAFAVERTALAWRRTGALHMATALVTLRMVEGVALRVCLCSLLLLTAVWSMGRARSVSAHPERARSVMLLASSTVGVALLGTAAAAGA